jgi:hypothetical protein
MDWLDGENSTKLGIVSAHNQYMVYNLAEKVFEQSVTCVEKSMLYSAKILKIDEKTLIASGTVYNEVLLWDPQNGTLFGRFKAHDGVIFNIGFDASKSLLYSVSDDRYGCRCTRFDPTAFSSYLSKLKIDYRLDN